jgi:hypothetical protein
MGLCIGLCGRAEVLLAYVTIVSVETFTNKDDTDVRHNRRAKAERSGSFARPHWPLCQFLSLDDRFECIGVESAQYLRYGNEPFGPQIHRS